MSDLKPLYKNINRIKKRKKDNYRKELRIKTKNKIKNFIYKSTKEFLINTYYSEEYFIKIKVLIKIMVHKWIYNKSKIDMYSFDYLTKAQYKKILIILQNVKIEEFLCWIEKQQDFKELLFNCIYEKYLEGVKYGLA